MHALRSRLFRTAALAGALALLPACTDSGTPDSGPLGTPDTDDRGVSEAGLSTTTEGGAAVAPAPAASEYGSGAMEGMTPMDTTGSGTTGSGTTGSGTTQLP